MSVQPESMDVVLGHEFFGGHSPSSSQSRATAALGASRVLGTRVFQQIEIRDTVFLRVTVRGRRARAQRRRAGARVVESTQCGVWYVISERVELMRCEM